MTSQAKLTVRPLPHLDFVLGYPGIPASSQASRNAAHISGNIEVRLGSKGMKARWIRVELRKLENAAGGEHWGELIGRGPIDVWTARAGGGRGDRSADDDDGSHWEVLQTADFPFRIAIPEGLPSSCKLDKQCGISYEVVASLCVKTPKGLFRKEETTSVIQSMHPVTIEKHELHSTWPVYNQPETHSGENGLLKAKLRRERSCYAPGDRIKVKVIVSSNRVEPAKLKSVAFTLKETVTFHGGKSGRMNLTSNSATTTGKAASQHVEIITQKAKQVGKKMYKGDTMDFDLECLIPKSHPLMTVATAKHIEVSYTMRVYVDISKAPIVIDHVPMVMTTFPRAQSIEMMRKIGFVDGLSERDMMLDDDDDDGPLMRKPTITPGPQPTRGYSGSSSSRYGQSMVNGVQRRDTVMTNFSGPGMAGRGIPGQIFNYGSYGAVQAYPDDMAEPPRPAFAGPPSIYEGGEGNLSATERAALSHYHTATPQDAAALGVDYSALATGSGLETPPVLSRAHFEAIPEEARPVVQQHLQQHHAAVGQLTEAALTRQQQRDAEEEKERLYQRAQQQAERNQRRADERRAQALLNGASLPPSATSSRANTPSVVNGRNAPPIRPASAAALTTAEEEKRRLYERARREAETYQRGYAHGATFPEEQAENISSSSSSNAFTRPANQSRHSTGAPAANVAGARYSGQQRRDSELYWLDSPAVDPLEARGIHALGTQHRQSSSPQRAIPASSSSSSQAPLATPVPPGAFPSAEEEKKRLYDQAKAQTESHLQSQQAANSSSVPASASRQSMQGPQIVAPSASSEKAQIARFQAAIDEVQRRQANMTPQPQQQGGVPASASAGSAGPLASQRMSVPSPAPTPVPALSEKEQMRLYYEAKDRQAEAENSTAPPASASSSSTVRPLNGQSSQVVSPKPTHANTYQNGMPSTVQAQNYTSPLPQGSFPSQGNANGNRERNRVVSYTPSSSATLPPPTHSASPSLPSFSALTLGNDISSWRGGTPKPDEGPWAPTVSSSNWLDANSSANRAAASSSGKTNGPPPPIPPKTPLLPLWK